MQTLSLMPLDITTPPPNPTHPENAASSSLDDVEMADNDVSITAEAADDTSMASIEEFFPNSLSQPSDNPGPTLN